MRSRSNGGVIGAYALPTQNYANGVFFIHDAAIYNTGNNPIWPLGTGFIYSATGGTIGTAADNANYRTHTFTANGTFSVVTGSGYLDILLVGGGGSTGGIYINSTTTQYYGLGGGGGGTVALVQNLFVNGPTSFTVEVGQGGVGGIVNSTTPTAAGVNGYPSKVTSTGVSIIARGGGGGGVTQSTYASKSGGTGGGGHSYWVSTTTYNSGVGSSAGATDSYTLGSDNTTSLTYFQNAGGAGDNRATGTYTVVNAGGGGGAGSAGYPGYYATNTALCGYGGDGYQWNRTGYYYGAGGAGGCYSFVAKSGLIANSNRLSEGDPGSLYSGYGLGGGGVYTYVISGTSQQNGINGGNGTVIFCYRYK